MITLSFLRLWMEMKSHIMIIFGYLLIIILIIAIGYAYYNEENTLAMMDYENESANGLRSEISELNMQLTTLTLMGETAVEWADLNITDYHRQRVLIDSILYLFSKRYSCEQSGLDSLRTLLEQKEVTLGKLAEISRQKKTLEDEMANGLPVIAYQSKKKEEKKSRRKSFLGIFGKKETESPTTNTTMRYRFNYSLMKQRKVENDKLKACVDSLSQHNRLLNAKMQALIRLLEDEAEEYLRLREKNISTTRKESYRDISILTAIVLMLLLAALVIIHYDIRRNSRNQRQLEDSIKQNNILLDMRKKIILTISHDIRGPLNVISGSAELAIDTRDKRKRDSYLNNARYLCRHVVHLLNNLLDVYRLNEAKETPNNIPFRLNVLLDRIAAGSAQIINDKGLLFTHSFKNVDVTVSGDEDRIEQIADNLLSNAVKFTKSGTVGISAEYNDGRLVMEISDTGMGMTEETIERIFKPFERADNVGHVEGFGLGLPITKGLVTLLGGTIDVVSNVNKGTVFRVAIPLPATAGVCVADNPVRETDGELSLPFNVLVVDDDPLQCGIVSEMLERKSISCTVCTTVSDVVKAMRKRDYDILLSDINMPGTDGFALLELLRRSNIGNSRRIPVIAMTARDEDDCRSLLGHGFSGCIFKPFSMQELLERISSVYVGHKPVARMDLSVLTENVDNKTKIIQSLIDTTTSDMSALKNAVADLNRKEISGILHRIYPMWTMLRMEAELTAFSIAVNNRKTTSENIQALSVRVIKAMEKLIENAKEEMETLRNEEQDFNS